MVEPEEEIIDTSSKPKAALDKDDPPSEEFKISEDFVDTWNLVDSEEQDLPDMINHNQNQMEDLVFEKHIDSLLERPLTI